MTSLVMPGMSMYPSGSIDFAWKKQLNDVLWKQAQEGSPFCDVKVTVQGKEFPAHWCVLMTCPYFESLYSSGMIEKASGKVDLSFSDVETVELVLEYIYMGKQSITAQSAEPVLKLADYLQLENLKRRCGDYLRLHEVNVDSCLHLCTVANMYNLNELYKVAQECLYASFHEVVMKTDILSVPFDVLLGFIEDPNLAYYTQVKFFDLVVRWVKHSLAERRGSFDAFFAALQLDTIGFADMAKIKEEKLVSDSKACMDLVKRYESSVNKGEISPDNCYKDVIVFGGIRKSSRHFAYVIDDKRWARLPFMEQRHNHFCKNVYASTVIDNQLYVLKEEESYSASSRLFKLDNEKRCWERLELSHMTDAFMFRSISRHSAVVACGQYMCMIDNTKRWVSPFETDHSEVVIKLFPTAAGLQNKLIKVDTLGGDFNLLALKACAMQDKRLCILAETMTRGRTSRSLNRCVCVDIPSGKIVDCSKGAKYGAFLHSDDNGKVFVHSHIGAKHSYVLDYTTQKWRTARFSLPAIKGTYLPLTQCSTVCNKDVYVFADRLLPTTLPHVFSYKKREWEELPAPPMRFSLPAVPMVMKVPAAMVMCPPNCPHCKKSEPYVPQYDDDEVGTASEVNSDEEYYEDDYYRDSDSMYDSDSNGPADCTLM